VSGVVDGEWASWRYESHQRPLGSEAMAGVAYIGVCPVAGVAQESRAETRLSSSGRFPTRYGMLVNGGEKVRYLLPSEAVPEDRCSWNETVPYSEVARGSNQDNRVPAYREAGHALVDALHRKGDARKTGEIGGHGQTALAFQQSRSRTL